MHDLIATPARDMPELAQLIAQLAVDHHNNRRRRMTGAEILQWFEVRNYRRMHRRFASSIYHKVRDTLELTDERGVS